MVQQKADNVAVDVTKEPIEPEPLADSAWLRECIKDKSALKYYVEHGMANKNYFTYHMVMGATGLQQLGVIPETIEKLIAAREAEGIYEPAERWQRPDDEVLSATPEALLGKRKSYYAIRLHFARLLKGQYDNDVTALIRGEFPKLSTGMLAHAFHGLLILGYGFSTGVADFALDGLSYLHHSFVPIAVADDLTNFGQGDQGLADVIRAVRADLKLRAQMLQEINRDVWFKREGEEPELSRRFNGIITCAGKSLGCYVDSLQFPATWQARDPWPQQLEVLGRWLTDSAIILYATATRRNDFFLLHGVTASWALRQLLPCLTPAHARSAIRFFLISLLGVYIAQDMPKLTPLPEASGIPRNAHSLTQFRLLVHDMVHRPVRSADEHTYKLVQVCYERYRENKDKSMRALYYDAAYRTVNEPSVIRINYQDYRNSNENLAPVTRLSKMAELKPPPLHEEEEEKEEETLTQMEVAAVAAAVDETVAKEAEIVVASEEAAVDEAQVDEVTKEVEKAKVEAAVDESLVAEETAEVAADAIEEVKAEDHVNETVVEEQVEKQIEEMKAEAAVDEATADAEMVEEAIVKAEDQEETSAPAEEDDDKIDPLLETMLLKDDASKTIDDVIGEEMKSETHHKLAANDVKEEEEMIEAKPEKLQSAAQLEDDDVEEEEREADSIQDDVIEANELPGKLNDGLNKAIVEEEQTEVEEEDVARVDESNEEVEAPDNEVREDDHVSTQPDEGAEINSDNELENTGSIDVSSDKEEIEDVADKLPTELDAQADKEVQDSEEQQPEEDAAEGGERTTEKPDEAFEDAAKESGRKSENDDQDEAKIEETSADAVEHEDIKEEEDDVTPDDEGDNIDKSTESSDEQKDEISPVALEKEEDTKEEDDDVTPEDEVADDMNKSLSSSDEPNVDGDVTNNNDDVTKAAESVNDNDTQQQTSVDIDNNPNKTVSEVTTGADNNDASNVDFEAVEATE